MSSSSSSAQSIIDSFDALKQRFNVKIEVINSLNQFNLFNQINNEIRFSSDSLYCLLLLMIRQRRDELVILFNNMNIKVNQSFDYNIEHHDEIHYLLPPEWYQSFDDVMNDVKNDWVHALNWIRFCNFIYDIIKRLNKRSTNRFKNSIHQLMFILAIHELFDSFKSGIVEYLDQLIPNNEVIEWVDIETIPRKSTKKSLLPRGVRSGEFIKRFFVEGADYKFHHLIIDVQKQELELTFNDSLNQIMLNLLNDITFYVRFLPGCNLQALINDEEEGFNIHGVSYTRNSLMKKFE